MKKLIFVTLSGLICFNASAGIKKADDVKFISKRGIPYEESRIGFDLVNKAKHPIWIVVKNGDTIYPKGGESALKLDKPTAAEFKRVQLKLDIYKPTQMAVWYSDPAGPKGIKTLPNELYTFDQGRTMYLLWDPENDLLTQTGPWGGLGYKTVKNLSLKDNVREIYEESPADSPWLRALLESAQAK